MADVLGQFPAPLCIDPAEGWIFRRHRAKGRILLHGFTSDYAVTLNEAMEAFRAKNTWDNKIIDAVTPRSARCLNGHLAEDGARLSLILPLDDGGGRLEMEGRKFRIHLPEGCYYFVLSVEL